MEKRESVENADAGAITGKLRVEYSVSSELAQLIEESRAWLKSTVEGT